ncbi:MerR family transcriptional regulator [Salimicrobium halophilum]|uniref:DNA-binding transcriptional regulator, MerR family n=1 Tax=Salimicrobium halophilum TaxID=86666 RepID=A0A1G8R0V9_9BACI|nr:MerR family transcriptional regulator [Salimicrobium halophilum]SDJ10616.1 DNA-binding transcriptional regulator, MerR family [Salimicrobium halophilum]
MKTKEVAEMAGVSVRTLHHYDSIGLLVPVRLPSGYRSYSDSDIQLLQQILFFRELGFSLDHIKDIVHDSSYDVTDALLYQRKLMEEEKNRVMVMIRKLDETIEDRKGERVMSNQDKFQGIDFSHNPYEQEARENWGDAVVNESNRKMSGFDNEELKEKWERIFRELGAVKDQDPRSEEAQKRIGELYHFLNSHFGTYSPEAFRSLGEMYVSDERFTENIDQYGEGLSLFLRDGMAEWSWNHK